jgi:glycosyltransferase involved in cell wall biosynthesis
MTDVTTPTISVVIRCFNERKHIGNLLEALGRQRVRAHEIIVVDSGSTDGTLDVVRQFPARIVRISPEEFTFGRSLNRGCAAATGEILVFASAHVLPVNDAWLAQLAAPFRDAEVGLVYGRQVGNGTTSFSEHQVFAKHYPPRSDFDQQAPFCNNANCAVRRSLWEQHQYDELLSGLEDLAWAKWLKALGGRIVYNADGGIIHIHEETARQTMRRYRREAIALRRVFPDSHMSLLEMLRFLVYSIGIDVKAAVRAGRLGSVLADILVYRTVQYVGTYLGLHQRSAVTHQMIMRYYYPAHYAPPGARGASHAAMGSGNDGPVAVVGADRGATADEGAQ